MRCQKMKIALMSGRLHETKACDGQICKLVTFFMPSSSWLRKLPIVIYIYDADIPYIPYALINIQLTWSRIN